MKWPHAVHLVRDDVSLCGGFRVDRMFSTTDPDAVTCGHCSRALDPVKPAPDKIRKRPPTDPIPVPLTLSSHVYLRDLCELLARLLA